ncbi:hypothetical protein [Trichormus variabilis]|uniref:Uncharacterized protein n=1 Tax=Trichormus variabilis SAG 1403-4b TaxID=447716 RepID=A0A433V1G2_ANAVA|nr:hypothetical protein [Trichormus variabilis]MBD2627280.1 hypothetical protein [Trichormus variabilis FACHB-164]RUS99924.1 hypothetical protein DSM107003_05080 [Trichormus variabilis SAG 1403-4b]
MKRRKFIQYSLIGGGSFVLNLGLYNSQPADAFFFGLLLRALLNSAFSGFQTRDERWYKARKEVMLAEREFIRQQFTTVGVAQVNDPQDQYNVVVASERKDPLANNVAFGFPRIENDQEFLATSGGPGSVGMTYAAEYLKQNRNMDVSEVNSSIIPKLSGGFNIVSDMRGWSDSTSFNYYPNNYSDTGVGIRYDRVNSRKGTFGLIDVTVAANQLIKIPQIRVKLS